MGSTSRIYNRALSAQEVQQLYKLGTANVAHSNTVTLATGLVGYWPLDGNTTSWITNTTQDVSGNGNIGQLISMSTTTSPTPGKIGGALKFNGISQYIDAGNPAGLNIATGGSVSMCAWVYSNTGPNSSWQGIVGKRAAATFAYGINFSTNIANHIQVYTSGSSGAQGFAYNIPVKTWTYICGIISSNPTRLYVNGMLFGTAGSGGGVLLTSNDLTIGSSYTTAEYLNGTIDDVRIYNRALSAQEVQQLYKLGTANVAHSNTVTLATGLVGYWPLDGNTTSWITNTTQDVSGNGNIGQLISMSTTTSPTPGKIGGALKFNGSTNYITLPSAFMATTGGISVCAWIYPKSYGTTAAVIAQRTSELTTFPQNWTMYINSTSHTINFQSSADSYAAANGGTVKLTAWQFVCGTYSGTGTKVRTVYLNASQVGQVVNSTDPPTSIGSAVPAIGAGGTDNFEPYKFVGTIDDVRIYNRALSAQEVAQLYAAGR